MELYDAILNRRSVRAYLNKNVEPEKIKRIIECATFAPSGCNLQEWKFIVIDDKAIQERLVDMGAAVFIKHAPMGILVLYANDTLNVEYKDHLQSASAAIQNMLLSAYEQGLSACWVCQLPLKGQLRKLLRVPDIYDPVAYITVGYSDRQPRTLARKYCFEDVVAFNAFQFKDHKRSGMNLRLSMKRFCKRVYYLLPLPVKRMINPWVDKRFVAKFDQERV